ncbi:hypothetical protein BKA70DRAFT_1502355 [Coprinopsis sp. MPI-PUGE-AT-0042]|nr:hypothetical protein BKA70DRAFT_1502355 [Coprinopsis sp. MPI-PUGE-AT-0042]
MMVCKAWYLAGKRYLYQDIDIKRPTQLFQLLDSLKGAPGNGELVKGLHVTCFIGSEWAAKFSKTLQSVVHRLPWLLTFTFHSSMEIPLTFKLPSLLAQGHGLTLSLDTSRAAIGVETPLFQSVKAALSSALVGLQLAPFPLFLDGNQLKHLRFPFLESIEVSLEFYSKPILETWHMPRLHRATLVLNRERWGPEHFIWFLEKHGQQGWEDNIIVSHPTLLWIDVWLSNIARPLEEIKDSMLRHTQKTCPALQGMRLLDYALVHLSNLPFLLPPYSVRNSRDAYEVQFLGFHLRHASWCVFAFDQGIEGHFTVHNRDKGGSEAEDSD